MHLLTNWRCSAHLCSLKSFFNTESGFPPPTIYPLQTISYPSPLMYYKSADHLPFSPSCCYSASPNPPTQQKTDTARHMQHVSYSLYMLGAAYSINSQAGSSLSSQSEMWAAKEEVFSVVCHVCLASHRCLPLCLPHSQY